MTVDTKRLRELEAATTKAPWRTGTRIVSADGAVVAHCAVRGPDAALIAEARNALPALLDRVERLEALLAAVREHEAAERATRDEGYWGRPRSRVVAAIAAKRAALAALEEP